MTPNGPVLPVKPGIAAAILVGSCVGAGLHASKSQQALESQEAPERSLYEETVVGDGGTIRGIVRLADGAPGLEEFPVTKNADVCGATKPSPRLRVSENRGVPDAVVAIEGITRGKPMGREEVPLLLQRDCEYHPHVQVVPVGGPLEIVNDDPVLHNVHGYERRGERWRTIFNIAQPVQGQRARISERRFRSPRLVRATCDAGHAWMSAYVVVGEHPYYAVTDANGEFSLEDVPPGSYTLRMWHEGVAVVETEFEDGKPKKYHFEAPYEVIREVVVPPNGMVRVEFELVLR
ncbi:MAG: hypothetical protein ACE5HP_13055 [Gemmatimonadota bacterium]